MERRLGIVLVAVGALTLASLVALALLQTPLPSRTLSLDELRTGVDFVLSGVRVQEVYFLDRSMMDAGTTVAFLVHFADGTSENVSLLYQTFLCRDVTVATAHTDPQVVLSARCGETSVLVFVR